jgi:DNA replication protein DnaC
MAKTIAETPEPSDRDLRQRACRLGLWGLLANWERVLGQPWLPEVLRYEELERGRRSLERRIRNARLGRFKPMSDFDWNWPKAIDRDHIEELFTLDFLEQATNVVLVGGNGLGKTMIAKNLAHRAIMAGSTARFVTASELLNDLAAQETASALSRRLRHYCFPRLLAIDEVGYLATSSEHADLLFELVSRRYEEKSTVLTTNRIFREWDQVFPSSTCVATLIDRLVHKSEIIKIEGDSYRRKEAMEREKEGAKRRSTRRKAAS